MPFNFSATISSPSPPYEARTLTSTVPIAAGPIFNPGTYFNQLDDSARIISRARFGVSGKGATGTNPSHLCVGPLASFTGANSVSLSTRRTPNFP